MVAEACAGWRARFRRLVLRGVRCFGDNSPQFHVGRPGRARRGRPLSAAQPWGAGDRSCHPGEVPHARRSVSQTVSVQRASVGPAGTLCPRAARALLALLTALPRVPRRRRTPQLCRRPPLGSSCRQEGDSAGVRGRPGSLLLRPACARGPWSQRFWVRGCCSGSPGRTPGCFAVARPFLGLAARYKTQGWFSLVGIG